MFVTGHLLSSRFSPSRPRLWSECLFQPQAYKQLRLWSLSKRPGSRRSWKANAAEQPESPCQSPAGKPFSSQGFLGFAGSGLIHVVNFLRLLTLSFVCLSYSPSAGAACEICKRHCHRRCIRKNCSGVCGGSSRPRGMKPCQGLLETKLRPTPCNSFSKLYT